MSPPQDEAPEAFILGWTQGVADASARLVGIVASDLGLDHPVVERMVLAIGRLVDEAESG